MSFYGRAAGTAFIVFLGACGGGGDDGKGGGAAAGSTSTAVAGAPAGGSTGAAGSTTSGGSNSEAGKSAGGGGAGAASTAAHCSPGTVPQPAFNFFGGIVDQCPSVSGLTGDVNHLLDIELSKPLAPGGTFSFSVGMKAPEGDFDVYGTTRECGDVGEKLASAHVLGNGVICYTLKPVTGTYTHLIWVWRVAAEVTELALCESGMCPGP